MWEALFELTPGVSCKRVRWYRLGLRGLQHADTIIPGRPSRSRPQDFRTGLRTTFARVAAHQELLLEHGLREALPAELTEMVKRYEQVAALADAGRRGHTGARTEDAGRWAGGQRGVTGSAGDEGNGSR